MFGGSRENFSLGPAVALDGPVHATSTTYNMLLHYHAKHKYPKTNNV